MTEHRLYTLPAILVMVMAALTGCLADDGDNETSPSGDGTGFGGNFTGNASTNVSVTVTIDSIGGGGGNETGNETGGNATGGNSTGGNATGNETGGNETGLMVMWTVTAGATIEETAVVWGNESVSDPQNTTDYGNSSDPESNVDAGSFDTSIEPEGSGTFYVRAYAIVNGTTYWSGEETAEWEGTNATAGTVHMVNITSATVGALSQYDPDELTIKVGDSVVWVNDDNEAHTATSDDDEFDTGDIEGGESSAPIVFDTAGEFGYHDSAGLANNMFVTGTIVVE